MGNCNRDKQLPQPTYGKSGGYMKDPIGATAGVELGSQVLLKEGSCLRSKLLKLDSDGSVEREVYLDMDPLL